MNTFSHYSDLTQNYARYRPKYPRELIAFLKTECRLTPDHVIADVGSGTGQIPELLLENGNTIYAVEPNAEMRSMAETLLGSNPRFVSIDGTAEATTLPDHSIDLITVGNAFHWFKHDPTRAEFLRILKPNGWVILLWNLERGNGSPFALAFESFWKKYVEPKASFARFADRKRPDYIPKFFGEENVRATALDNYQVCDRTAFQGLIGSFLHAPKADDPRYPIMIAELEAIFSEHQRGGVVTLEYDTAIIYGQLK